MKNNKKDITKLKYVKLNSTNNLNQIVDQLNVVKLSSVKNDASEEPAVNKPTYKKFEEAQQTQKDIDINNLKKNKTNDKISNKQTPSQNIEKKPESILDSINFKLPKFLADRQEQKERISALKKPQTEKFGGSLPYTEQSFLNNPNSFTTIFNKDNDKINGFQRVFRKSLIFLILQLLSFSFISFLILSGIGLNFSTGLATFSSIVLVTASIIFYTAITCIFYIIVADRSYIWVSILFQSLFLIFIYTILGLGLFSFATLFFAFLIFVLSYFAYLEVEKIQVSTRFFSVGYVTSEALKILSTVALLVISLAIFNTITIQTPKVFISKNLINNESVYDTLVSGNSFPFNIINLNKLALNGEKYAPNASGVIESGGKIVDFRTFLLKNYKQSGFLNENEKRQIRTTCDTQNEKECLIKLANEQDKKLKLSISVPGNGYDKLAFGLDETLTKSSFKDVLRSFYSEKIDDLNSQSTTINEISYLRPFKLLLEPILPYIIQSSIAILIFMILSFFKFFFNILISILIWIFWKIMLATGFVKIDVELVESEIVSI